MYFIALGFTTEMPPDKQLRLGRNASEISRFLFANIFYDCESLNDVYARLLLLILCNFLSHQTLQFSASKLFAFVSLASLLKVTSSSVVLVGEVSHPAELLFLNVKETFLKPPQQDKTQFVRDA